MYLCASDQIQIFKTDGIAEFEEGKHFLGGGFNFVQIPTTGYFAALDVTTNKLVWRQHWGETCYSGSSVTAGGLVFVGRNDGRLLALDSSDGSHLWEFQTGAGVNAPSAVFEHKGKQYVVVYSAGNLFARSAKGDSVWLFALHGSMDQVEAAMAGGTGTTDGVEVLDGLDPDSADLDTGARIYTQVCAFCHADSGIGGHDGVPLVNATDTMSNARTIYAGRNKMPAFGAAYTPEEIRDLGAYVVMLAKNLGE